MLSGMLHSVLRAFGMDGMVSVPQVQAALADAGWQDETVLAGQAIHRRDRRCPHCRETMNLKVSEGVDATVLCLSGWKTFRHIPSRCRRHACDIAGKRVWYNYIACAGNLHEWAWDDENRLQYFFSQASWGVSTEWLRQFTQRAAFQFVSFRTEAEVFSRLTKRAAREAQTRDETPAKAYLKMQGAWFRWRIVVRLFEYKKANRAINLSLGLQELLREAWAWYPDHMFSERVRLLQSHGWQITKAVIDGNAKLARRVCARAVAEMLYCSVLDRYTVTQCSCAPAFRLKVCSKHAAPVGDAFAGPPQSEVVVAHRKRSALQAFSVPEPYEVCLVLRGREDDRTAPRRWTQAGWATPGQLQEYWDKKGGDAFLPARSSEAALRATACRTHKEAAGRSARAKARCGWLYACTPEGYILHLKEYVVAESLSQRYFFLAELVARAPTLDQIRHDDACHLRKFADARATDSDLARRLAYPRIQYITDGLHDRNHVDPWCLANCSPKVPSNAAAVAGDNSQVCEQLFAKIGRHKHSVRHMGKLTSAFFLNEMAATRNDDWLESHAPRL